MSAAKKRRARRTPKKPKESLPNIVAANWSATGKSQLQGEGAKTVPGDWNPNAPQLARGPLKAGEKSKAWADRRKKHLQELCAERCVQFPLDSLNDHAQDLFKKCKVGYIKFQNPEGNNYNYTYSIRVLKEIIRPAFMAHKDALKNRKK